MNDRQWDEFFDLLRLVVDLPGKTWQEKRDQVQAEAFSRDAETALEEFTGRECVITQKVDGTSGTFYLRGGEFGVCTRNLELLDDPASMFWRIAREHKLREALVTLGGDYALQGEVHGEGIQGNHLGAKGVGFAAFNLFDITNHAYANHQTLEGFCQTTGLPMVRTVWRGEFRFTLAELVQLASAQDYAPGQPAEGIVIRPVVEELSRILESGRLSAKVISERYALKYGE